MEDFVAGGGLDKLFTINQAITAQLARITMAQKQFGNPPSLELQFIWHLIDVEEKRKKRLLEKGLDISWVLEATKKAVTDLFYASTGR